MKPFMQVVHEDSQYMKTVNEGWGKVAVTLGVALGLIAGTGSTILAGTAAASYELFSYAHLKLLFRNSKLKKYLDDFNKKTFNELKKSNSDITMDLPNNGHSYEAWLRSSTDAAPLKYDVYSLGNIFVYYDATHIQEVRCVYFNRKNKTYCNKKVPAPSNKELGFHE